MFSQTVRLLSRLTITFEMGFWRDEFIGSLLPCRHLCNHHTPHALVGVRVCVLVGWCTGGGVGHSWLCWLVCWCVGSRYAPGEGS